MDTQMDTCFEVDQREERTVGTQPVSPLLMLEK